MLKSIIKTWAKFEAWVHAWFPGFKTRATAALGAVSSAATAGYGYIQGLPETKWLKQETLMALSFGLFTLSYWFSNMGERVKSRKN